MEASLGLNISFGEAPEHKQCESLISLYAITQNQAHFPAHLDLSPWWSPGPGLFIPSLPHFGADTGR